MEDDDREIFADQLCAGRLLSQLDLHILQAALNQKKGVGAMRFIK